MQTSPAMYGTAPDPKYSGELVPTCPGGDGHVSSHAEVALLYMETCEVCETTLYGGTGELAIGE